MSKLTSLLVRLAPLTLSITAARSGELFVVDSQGTTPYVTIQSAIDASTADDIVVVLDRRVQGSYAGFELNGRGGTVVARQGRDRIGGITVRDLPAGERVTLIGLSLQGYSSLRLVNCAGSITVADVWINGTPDVASIEVDQCADVRITRCRLDPGQGTSVGFFAALDVRDSQVWVDSSEIEGNSGYDGAGSFTHCFPGGPGGPGVRVRGASSRVELRSSSVRGGAGGYGTWYWCDGPMGPALVATMPSMLLVRDSSIHPTPAVGSVTWIAGDARTLDAAWLQRADGRLGVRAEGYPGDTCWLLHAPRPGVLAFGSQSGTLLVDPSALRARVSLGICGPTGVAEGELTLPVPSGDDVSLWWVQVATAGPGGVVFGEPHPVVQVGPDAPIAPPGEALRVDAAALVPGSGRSWSSAMADVYDAALRTFGTRSQPAEIWLREGIYVVGGDGVVRTRPLILASGCVLRGGFRGDELTPEERSATGHATILSGDAFGDDGPGFANRSENSRKLLATDDGSPREWRPKVLLERLTVSGTENSTSHDVSCALTGEVTLEAITMTDNRIAAGTLLKLSGDTVLDRCRFHGNHAKNVTTVAGFNHLTGSGLVTSSAWIGNRGMALSMWISSTISHSTLASNVLPVNGTALMLYAWSGPQRVSNSVIWNNSAAGYRGEAAQLAMDAPSPSQVSIAYCCIGGYSGGVAGVALHGLDPRFVDPLGPDLISGTADDDYRLRSGSPCVDAGDNGLTPVTALLDLDGRPRIADDPATPDTGVGGPPVVDMGAYER